MLENFFLIGEEPLVTETGVYSLALVLLSYVVAALASYTALDIAVYLPKIRNRLHQRWWLLGGALAMGAGIWSMHFIGMLAYKMDMAMAYDPLITGFSMVPAFIVSYFVLHIIRVGKINGVRIIVSAVLMGLGICAMHYTGMAAMEMDGDIRYRPVLFSLSVMIAIAASGAALFIAFMLAYRIQKARFKLKIAAALIMGLAICGMHYTGMAATVFIPWAECRYDPDQSFTGLALTIALVTFVILGVALSLRIYLTGFSEMDERERRSVKQASYIIIFILFLAGAGLSIFLSRFTEDIQHKQIERIFAEKTITFTGLFERQLQEYEDVIEATKAYFLASNNVDRNEFKIFSYSLLFETPGIDSVMFVPRVPRGKLETYRDKMTSSREDFNLQIIQNKSRALYQEEKREHYYPVHFAEPYFKYKDYIGLDILSLLSVPGGLQDRMKSFKPFVTALLSPLYQKESGILSVLCPFEFTALDITPVINPYSFQQVGNGSNPVAIILVNFDMEATITRLLQKKQYAGMYVKASLHTGEENINLYSANVSGPSWNTNSIEYFLGQWTLEFWPKKEFLSQYTAWQSKAVLGGGFLISFLLASYAYMVVHQREKDRKFNKDLEKEKKYLSTILDNMRQGVITIDKNGTIESFNEWSEFIFGYQADEAIGKNVNVLMPEPEKSKHDHYIQSYLKTGRAKIIDTGREVKALRKNGDSFPAYLNVTEIKHEDRHVFVGLVMDFTEQREKETALRHAKQEADQASQAKSDFLANMSHELRTPLNSILGMTRIFMEDSNLTKDNREMASTVFKSANNLLEIVNDILDISKIESGNMVLENIGFDMKDMVANIMETMAPLASEKGISLNYKFQRDDLPYLKGDPLRVSRVLTNLVSNAIKYTDKGQIDIAIKGKEQPEESVDIETFEIDKAGVDVDIKTQIIREGKMEIHCTVSDTGIGIPEEKLHKIFEKFSQADASTTRKYGGTGLGLPITKELVEMMGGTIGVESEVGVGSTFWFKIPFDITDTLDEKEKDRQKSASARNTDNAYIPLENTKILVAEDHLLNQDFIQRLLKRMGFQHIDIVETGEEAVSAFEKDGYDLILMDCHMPEKSGYDATHDIRKSKKKTGKTIPIIALTADAMAGTRQKCLDAGMDDYVTKPIDSDELKNILAQWVIFSGENQKSGEGGKAQETEQTEQGGNGDKPVDMSLLREYADTDEDLRNFLDIFIKQSEESLKSLEEHARDGESKEWVDAAHKLKGGSGMIGAKKLQDLCAHAQNMESAQKQEREEQLSMILKEYKTVIRYLEDLVSQY